MKGGGCVSAKDSRTHTCPILSLNLFCGKGLRRKLCHTFPHWFSQVRSTVAPCSGREEWNLPLFQTRACGRGQGTPERAAGARGSRI